MKTITRLVYDAFAIVILVLGTLTANGAPGDVFASINGNDQKGGGFIYRYTADGMQSNVRFRSFSPTRVGFQQSRQPLCGDQLL